MRVYLELPSALEDFHRGGRTWSPLDLQPIHVDSLMSTVKSLRVCRTCVRLSVLAFFLQTLSGHLVLLNIPLITPNFPEMSRIHFVHENQPGTSLDSDQVRALRSHVRKVNLERSHQKSTQRLENFRSFTITDFEQDGKLKPTKRRPSVRPDQTQPAPIEYESAPSCSNQRQDCSGTPPVAETPSIAFQSLSPSHNIIVPRRCHCKRGKLSNQRLSPSEELPSISSPDARHPYTSQISKSINVDEKRIDQLLKSCERTASGRNLRDPQLMFAGAFQVAAEPMFTTSHVGGKATVYPVFPDCLANSAFLYALLYSIIHTRNRWETTNESLRLKGHAIKCLKDDLQRDDPALRALSIGTILILCGVAVCQVPRMLSFPCLTRDSTDPVTLENIRLTQKVFLSFYNPVEETRFRCGLRSCALCSGQ